MSKITTLYLLLFSVLLISCTKIKEPEFRRIENFRVKSAGFTSATIGVDATFFNPNNFSMAVKETDAEIYIDGVHVGRFVQDTTINVSSSGEFSIPISGTISLDKVLQLNLQDIGSRDVQVKATGSTKVGKAGLFITKPFDYAGTHRLDDIRL